MASELVVPHVKAPLAVMFPVLDVMLPAVRVDMARVLVSVMGSLTFFMGLDGRGHQQQSVGKAPLTL